MTQTKKSKKEESKEATRKLRQKGNKIILLTSISVIVVYVGVLLISLFSKDGLEPNEIGDTLGGTLSPLIGLVSAILIYITIGQQIEANRLIQEQFERQEKANYEETIFREVKSKLSTALAAIDELLLEFHHPKDRRNRLYLSQVLDWYITGKEPRTLGTTLDSTVHRKMLNSIPDIFFSITDILKFYSENIEKNSAYCRVILWTVVDFEEQFSRSLFYDYDLPRSNFPINEVFINGDPNRLESFIDFWKAIFTIREVAGYKNLEKKTFQKAILFWEELKSDMTKYSIARYQMIHTVVTLSESKEEMEESSAEKLKYSEEFLSIASEIMDKSIYKSYNFNAEFSKVNA